MQIKTDVIDSVLNKFKGEQNRRKVFGENGFEAFCNIFGYELARHHKEMAKRFERAFIEPDYNCMIIMPPGHAKSTYSSYLCPSYYLGRFPGKSITMATHTASFSSHWGRMVRNLINTDKYQSMMKASLDKDSRAADRFNLSNGSQYYACGVGGALTGRRSDFGIIDDPLRGIEDADSDIIREAIWRWYIYDFGTRCKPNASKFITSTRWHEDDLVGRILNSNQGKYWDVINFPAIAEEDDQLGRQPGEALWPDYISLEKLIKDKESLDIQDIRMWNSLYQCKPTFDYGSYFQSAWFKTIDRLPQNVNLTYYGASDYAVTSGGGDYTVHIVAAHDSIKDNLYIVDMWRGQEETNIWIEKFIDLCLKYNPAKWCEESGQIIKSLNPYIEREMIKRRCYTLREQFTSLTNKSSRAQSIRALMSTGYVYILNKDWTDDFLHELTKFPTGRNDDMVDAFSLIGRLMNEMWADQAKIDKPKIDVYKSNMILLPGLDEDINPKKYKSFERM